MHVAKRQWRKKKQTNRKKTSKLLCSSNAFFREYRVFSRTKEFKRRIWMLLSSLKHSPVSWFSFSLLRCILVCWRGTRTTLVPSNNIEACTTRSQLMARVPRSPSMANIASAQSFPRFSSQFFFFFSMFEFLGGQDSKMYRVHEQSSTSVNLYKGKHNRWSFHTDFLSFLVVISC